MSNNEEETLDWNEAKTSTKRTKRSAETRESQTRPRSWKPSHRLEVPDAPDGYRYRWVRYEVHGTDDSKNVLGRQREGYEPVQPTELEGYYDADLIEEGRFQGNIRQGDLMLMKIPEEIARQRDEYVQSKTNRLQQSVDHTLSKEDNKFMPLENDSRSQTHLGKQAEFKE